MNTIEFDTYDYLLLFQKKISMQDLRNKNVHTLMRYSGSFLLIESTINDLNDESKTIHSAVNIPITPSTTVEITPVKRIGYTLIITSKNINTYIAKGNEIGRKVYNPDPLGIFVMLPKEEIKNAVIFLGHRFPVSQMSVGVAS